MHEIIFNQCSWSNLSVKTNLRVGSRMSEAAEPLAIPLSSQEEYFLSTCSPCFQFRNKKNSLPEVDREHNLHVKVPPGRGSVDNTITCTGL